jgi:hypothetical protein
MSRFIAITTTLLLAIATTTTTRAAGLRKSYYKPQPAGPTITGTLEITSQSSTIPTYGGWIKFDVNVDGIPEDGKLPNKSKIMMQTICQQDFNDTVEITEEYDGSGTYMFNLVDGAHNTGKDRPWKKYFSGLCQTTVVYRYFYQDLNSALGEMNYHLASTKVYSIGGATLEHTEETS